MGSAGEDGVGLIATVIGFMVLMCLLLLAVQVTYGLYERSMLSAVAADAARVVSGSDAGATPSAVVTAEATARSELGRDGPAARFDWTVGTRSVQVTVSLPTPRFLPRTLTRPLGVASVSGSARMLREGA